MPLTDTGDYNPLEKEDRLCSIDFVQSQMEPIANETIHETAYPLMRPLVVVVAVAVPAAEVAAAAKESPFDVLPVFYQPGQSSCCEQKEKEGFLRLWPDFRKGGAKKAIQVQFQYSLLFAEEQEGNCWEERDSTKEHQLTEQLVVAVVAT